MWFKNIHVFSLVDHFALSAEQLQTLLLEHRARPCGKLEPMHYGWASPWGMGSDSLLHASQGRYLLVARKEEKLLPASVVKEQVLMKVAEIEREEHREVTGREKKSLFEQLSIQLLPQAFSKAQLTYAYIDLEKQWLVIDSSNHTRAEDLTVLLRQTLGSLKLSEIKVASSPSVLFTEWVSGQGLPHDFCLEDYCELQDPNSASTVIKCMNQDVMAKEVLGHIDSGKQVIKLALTWQDRITFIVDQQLGIRRIRFLDLVQQQVDDANVESPEEKFDADFMIFSSEFALFLPRLWEVFGGLAE